MNSLSITVQPKSKNNRKMFIEMDANKFEKLAASLGLFSNDFIKSLDRAEADYQAGRINKAKSLSELRHK